MCADTGAGTPIGTSGITYTYRNLTRTETLPIKEKVIDSKNTFQVILKLLFHMMAQPKDHLADISVLSPTPTTPYQHPQKCIEYMNMYACKYVSCIFCPTPAQFLLSLTDYRQFMQYNIAQPLGSIVLRHHTTAIYKLPTGITLGFPFSLRFLELNGRDICKNKCISI